MDRYDLGQRESSCDVWGSGGPDRSLANRGYASVFDPELELPPTTVLAVREPESLLSGALGRYAPFSMTHLWLAFETRGIQRPKSCAKYTSKDEHQILP
jgi:hypothetical protein